MRLTNVGPCPSPRKGTKIGVQKIRRCAGVQWAPSQEEPGASEGPMPSRSLVKQFHQRWGWHHRGQFVGLGAGPFCRPLVTRDATEVYHGVEGIIRDIEALTVLISEALCPTVPGTRTVNRSHSDCTSEFVGRVAERFALRHNDSLLRFYLLLGLVPTPHSQTVEVKF
eukprot:2636332-Amphidinium_carterae.3